MDPVVILSPHLDDAVLSCGQLMAGRPDTVVVTVFAGPPPPRTGLSHYDALCGFTDSREAWAARKREDSAALGHLAASQVLLSFPDHQYGVHVDPDALRCRIRDVIDFADPEYVLAPLGLAHPDHVAVREAACDVVPWSQLHLYEELPARVLWPDLVPDALLAVVQRVKSAPGAGAVLRWESADLGTGPLDVKMAAAGEYRSQVDVLRSAGNGAGWNAVQCPERYWRLVW